MTASVAGAERPHIVIVEAGFAGLYAARALRDEEVSVTVVDQHNYHLFQPLLYQVATAALNPSDIAYPIRAALRKQDNCEVLLAEVMGVDPGRRELILGDGRIGYDKLVLATGATHSYFGHPEWGAFAPGLKTVEDSLLIRGKVLSAYEAAERETDEATRAAWLNFVIVGAGPTGVELAGAFAEISRQALAGEFRHVDPSRARVLLLEGTPRVLPSYVPSLSEKAEKQLRGLGVEVRTSAMVTGIDAAGVTFTTVPRPSPSGLPTGESPLHERIEARTVIWAAGVAASPLARSLGVPLDRAGRVLVEPDLTVPGYPDVYIAGDLAAVKSHGDGQSLVPGVAPAAIQEGKHAVKNILLSLLGRPTEPFRYNDRGSLATIGRSAGVGDVRGLHLAGFAAWAAWLGVHIFFLIGFRNRLLVLFGWAWAYLTRRRPARLITGTPPPLLTEGTPRGEAPRRAATPAHTDGAE